MKISAHQDRDLRVNRAFWIALGIWLIIFVALVGLPLQILHTGYLPGDDALRHAAKAVSGKRWDEILLLRPEVTIDHNPGWHWFLGVLHKTLSWETAALVRFSVVAMFVVFACAPLPWISKPEAWLAAVAVIMLAFPYMGDRAFVGRPFCITIAVTLILLCMWTDKNPRSLLTNLLASIGLIAISAWVHGSWYLLLMIPAAFFLAGKWRESVLLGICWTLGTILGASLTGHPIQFLSQSAMIPYWALGSHVPPEGLVGEFQPLRDGYWPGIILLGAVIAWEFFKTRNLTALRRNPTFWLAVIGLLLGFRVVRFWLDWGIPALALLLASEIANISRLKEASAFRVALAAIAAIALFVFVGSDRNARWSQYSKMECLDTSRPDHREWVPEPGGILYAVDMSVFYETFFKNPHGEWRYAMGFEPTFMRSEDRAVYYEICRTRNAIRATAPWVEKMTPKDRLVLQGPVNAYPSIPRLEWHYAAQNLWVGRLRRSALVPQ